MTDHPLPADYRTGYLKMKSVLVDRTTGLPAFPLLFDRLRTLLEGRRAIGVLSVDVVELERVEALYGWQVFDAVVKRVADVLRDCIGGELPDSALLAQNGVAGERFVVFLPGRADGSEVDPAFLAAAGAGLCLRLEASFDEEAFVGLHPSLAFRTGQALLRDDPFLRFERSVYAALADASGADERRERRRERSWAEELRTILRRGAVQAVFQPIVELGTGEVVGHEALARGPQDSLFETPRAMFALSDRVGQAAELDRLCRDVALEAARALPRRGKLFLNVRPACLDPAGVEGQALGAALERHGVAPREVVLEISERAADAAPDAFVEGLRAARERGFAVAVDDVGTGRLGLAYLERAAPDYLKLDPCLVRNLHESLMQQELLRTLVRLAERIGGGVIGEGVESQDEAEALGRGGARFGQGHWFAAPAPPRPVRGTRGPGAEP